MQDQDDIPSLIEHDDVPELIPQPDPEPEDDRRVPCTLISGFLGAGKSTFLKRVLTERHGQRIAVIINEFADTADIEAKAINLSSTSGSEAGELKGEVLELANGCLCCSIKDTGLAAIEKLMQKKGAFDYILLETTGLADPGPIAAMFWQNEEYASNLGKFVSLDGVLCVVDAYFAEKQMTSDEASGASEFLRQVACADVVLLNKCDLVSEGDIQRLESTIRKVNLTASIHRTIQGQIDLKLVLGLNAYDTREFVLKDRLPHEHDHNHDDGEHGHGHLSKGFGGISSMQVSCPVMPSTLIPSLESWIQSVLWDSRLPDDTEHSVEVLRCKGAFMTGNGEQYVLQGVRSLYEITKLDEEETMDQKHGDSLVGKLVFIGKGLDDAACTSLLKVIGASTSTDL